MCWGDGGGRGERIPSTPPPAFPVLRYWADRGRPPAGLATLPAPPLCLHSNPGSWGRGEWGGDQGRGLGGDPLFWGEVPSLCVSVPGTGGLGQ